MQTVPISIRTDILLKIVILVPYDVHQCSQTNNIKKNLVKNVTGETLYLLSHDTYRTLPLVILFDLTWLVQMLISHNGQIKHYFAKYASSRAF